VADAVCDIFVRRLDRSRPFSSGSTGSDGALNLTTPGIVDFDPRTLGLDPDGDNVYHFTTITIGAGVTVRLLGPALNMKPVYWLASGAVQIDGTIDLSGGNGHPGTTNPTERGPSLPGAGGYPGGVGRFAASNAQNGTGPGAGKISATIGKTHQDVDFGVPRVACYPCVCVALADKPPVAPTRRVFL